VAVVEQLGWPVSDAAKNVAHLVKSNFVKAKFAHLGGSALACWPDLAVVAWDCTKIAEELNYCITLLGYALFDRLRQGLLASGHDYSL
jgi:hypothetical protein